MGRQKKRADGRIQKSFRINGKRYYAYGSTAAEAEAAAFNKRKEIEAGKDEHDNPTLEQYYERWTNTRRGSIKESTLHSQASQFKVCADVISKSYKIRIGEIKIRNIQVDDIRDIQNALLADGRRTQTVNDAISHLSHILNTALKERRIDYNPCCLVAPLKRTEERARDTHHRALTIEEQKAFFEAAKDSYYYTVFKFAILTGARVGEIGALMPHDIKNGLIHIERTITRLETGAYTIGESAKTESGRRQIPLNDAIKNVLEDQRQLNSILDNGITMINTPIFRAPERGLLMSTPINREIKRICKRCGVEYFTMHALRATFATRCIEQGINPRTVQELLGHADYALTMNLYGHCMLDTRQQAMDSIEIAL